MSDDIVETIIMKGKAAEEIRRLRAENEKFYKQAEMNARLLTENASLVAYNEKLRKDNKKLREALSPFAKKYTIKDDSLQDAHNALTLINVGDLRSAAAIRESEDE